MSINKLQKRGMKNLNKEYRSMTFENNENDEGHFVEGYAAVFEQPTVLYSFDGVDYYEVIDRHAFDSADLSDVPFKYNHNDGCMVVARTRNKSLQLEVDNHGLKVRAKLANTTAGNDMYESIRSGLLDKMSFAFTVQEDSYDQLTRTRRILKIDKVYDVSAVDIPAYDGTELEARSADFFINQIKKEDEVKLKRKRLLLLSEL